MNLPANRAAEPRWHATFALFLLTCCGACQAHTTDNAGDGVTHAGEPTTAGTGSAGTHATAGTPETAGNAAAGVAQAGAPAGDGSAEPRDPVSPVQDGTADAVDAGPSNASDAAAPQPTGTPPTGILPAVDDVWARGPFSVGELHAVGPQGDATVFYPQPLGEDGQRHPIALWGNGAGLVGPEFYRAVTEHVASHGFAVYITSQSSRSGSELLEGLAWIIAENTRAGSELEGKLETSKIASMGHSLGSGATLAIASDPRLSTTLHLSGGIAMFPGTIETLHAPAAFLCGENTGNTSAIGAGDLATPGCLQGFMEAPVPIFFAEIVGADHVSGFLQMHGAVVAWLRWHLAGDTTMKRVFVGTDCELCTRDNWLVMQRGLD